MPGPESAFLVSVAAYAVAALLTFCFLRPDPLTIARREQATADAGRPAGVARALGVILADVRVQLALATLSVSQFVMISTTSTSPLYLHDQGHSVGTIGVGVSLHLAGMYVASPLSGWLADRFGRLPVIGAGALVLLFAMGLAGLVPGTEAVPLILGLFLNGVGWNLAFVSGSALLTDALAPAERASVQGFADLLMGMMGAIGVRGGRHDPGDLGLRDPERGRQRAGARPARDQLGATAHSRLGLEPGLMLRLLPDLRYLGAGTLLNSIGMMGEIVVLGWLALELTDSPFLVGAAMGARALPLFFVGVPAGVIADRLPRQRLLIATGAGQALTAALMGVLALTGAVSLAQLVLLTFVGGILRGLEHAARQSYAHDVVGAAGLVSGLAILGVAMRTGWLVGSLGAGADHRALRLGRRLSLRRRRLPGRRARHAPGPRGDAGRAVRAPIRCGRASRASSTR